MFGSGAVGLSAVMAAVIRGAGPIVVVEPNMARRKLAGELGATAAIDPFDEPDVLAAVLDATGGGVDYAIDTTGNPDVISAAGESVRPNGSLALLGIPQVETNIPLSLGIAAISLGAGGRSGGAHSLEEWYDPTGRELGLQRVALTVLRVAGLEP